jgi:hypothetical protein
MGSDDEGRERGRCPFAECGKHFRDLKAHLLTHQAERPEKCPITTCPYHMKGFARKYDKNRHTLVHWKGTMVCGFCPDGGTNNEKSFNRSDTFKRHLTSVHGVEQSAPNSRKRKTNANSPSTSTKGKKSGEPHQEPGMCSTCSHMFSSAQEFYEHLDECVLKSLEQPDPAEAINARHLAEINKDTAVQQTMARNMLPPDLVFQQDAVQEEDAEFEEDDDVADESHPTACSTNFRSGKGQLKSKRNGSSS